MAWGATGLHTMKQEQLTEIRCRHCGKLLARGWIVEASLEHKCPRCGAYTILRATRPDMERPERLREYPHAESGQPVQRGRSV